MMSKPGPFKLVLSTHDLSPNPIAVGDELLCWMPFADFKALYAEIEAATAANGIALEITSDDAFSSDYELLLPWLIETGRQATFFIPTAYLGRPGRLTLAQVREMHGLGMRIGNHGTNHVNWARIPTPNSGVM